MNSRMEQLTAFTNGPIWDGNLISKTDRDDLYQEGYIERFRGWNFLTQQGVKILVQLGILVP